MLNDDIKKCPLFAGIEEKQLVVLLRCLAATKRAYDKDNFIFELGQKAAYVGIVLTGGVYVIQEDFWGNRVILAHMGSGELFGEAFSCAEVEKLPISVIAANKSEIMLIDYRKIVTSCNAACAFHTSLIKNMLRILADKNMKLTRKMEYISKRSIREKLLSFLSAEAVRKKNNTVVIPFNRQELADYLCVDRSALSRELSLMRQEGIIRYDKNRFELLQITPAVNNRTRLLTDTP